MGKPNKLTKEVVARCRREFKRGTSARQLALRYGVDNTSMHTAIIGNSWKSANPIEAPAKPRRKDKSEAIPRIDRVRKWRKNKRADYLNHAKKQYAKDKGKILDKAQTDDGWANLKLIKLRSRCKKTGIVCTLSKEDILKLKTDICPATGAKLDYRLYERRNGFFSIKHTPSIDRIDPTKGYTPDNVVLVSQYANSWKRDIPPKEFVQMLKNMTNYYERLCQD